MLPNFDYDTHTISYSDGDDTPIIDESFCLKGKSACVCLTEFGGGGGSVGLPYRPDPVQIFNLVLVRQTNSLLVLASFRHSFASRESRCAPARWRMCVSLLWAWRVGDAVIVLVSSTIYLARQTRAWGVLSSATAMQPPPHTHTRPPNLLCIVSVVALANRRGQLSVCAYARVCVCAL